MAEINIGGSESEIIERINIIYDFRFYKNIIMQSELIIFLFQKCDVHILEHLVPTFKELA